MIAGLDRDVGDPRLQVERADDVPDLDAVNLEQPKKFRIKWSATDPNEDELTFDLYVKKAGWKDWVLLERTILLLYGCCTLLEPDLNPIAIIQPYLREFVLGNRDFAQIAMEAVRDMAMSAMTLPEDMRKYLVKANRGELDVRVRGVYEGARTVYTTGRQIIYTSIGLVAAYEAIESYRRGEALITKWSGGVAIAMGVMLVLSSVLGRPRRR